MVTLYVRSIPRHRGTRTVVRFSDAFACAHMCAWTRVRVCVCLCVFVPFLLTLVIAVPLTQ